AAHFRSHDFEKLMNICALLNVVGQMEMGIVKLELVLRFAGLGRYRSAPGEQDSDHAPSELPGYSASPRTPPPLSFRRRGTDLLHYRHPYISCTSSMSISFKNCPLSVKGGHANGKNRTGLLTGIEAEGTVNRGVIRID